MTFCEITHLSLQTDFCKQCWKNTFSALSYFLFSFLSSLCDCAVRYSSDLLNQCIGVQYRTSHFSLSSSKYLSYSLSENHQKGCWSELLGEWSDYLNCFILEEKCFTAASSKKQKKVEDLSVLDIRGWKSRINIWADYTVISPATFLF